MIIWSKHSPSYRADDAFHIRALPRRPRSAENFIDVHDLNLLTELLPVDTIAIPNQIFRRGVERKGFEHLLCGPCRCGMSRDVKVDNASSVMGEDDKDEQDFKPNRVDGEEIDGSQLRYLIVEECFPRLRWWFRIANHVFGNGSLRDLNSQLHELAVDPRCAPNRILTAHGPDKITSFLRNSRAARPTVTNLPDPIPAAAPMTVSGLTMIREERQSDQSRDSHTPTHRSARLTTNRLGFWVRCSTVN
jgi:hypothetical protein